jgi:hypothetical protein
MTRILRGSMPFLLVSPARRDGGWQVPKTRVVSGRAGPFPMVPRKYHVSVTGSARGRKSTGALLLLRRGVNGGRYGGAGAPPPARR